MLFLAARFAGVTLTAFRELPRFERIAWRCFAEMETTS